MNVNLEPIRNAASHEGFQLVGVAPAVASAGHARLLQWIESGYAGSMDYFAKRAEAYAHPSAVLEGVRSIIVLSSPYASEPRNDAAPGFGRLARYIGDGSDYHDWIHPKLKRIAKELAAANPNAKFRGIVDTAPLMEREVAVLAGLGWQGKNTLLLNRDHGSYFFLACLLTSLELPTSQPFTSDHCGSCTACLDACPTQAFVGPRVLDASKCISYLTIEYDGPIDIELRSRVGDWLFGCDVCQEVCPWNRKPMRRAEQLSVNPSPLQEIELTQLFELDEDAFRIRFRKTPLWRAKRRGVLRNAAIVLGNQRNAAAIPALAQGLVDHEPLVRGASAWALGEIGGSVAHDLLAKAIAMEHDTQVRWELAQAQVTAGAVR